MKKINFWNFFIEKKPITWLVIFAITAFGSIAVNGLPRELQPEINIPVVSISAALPGASPRDVESLLTAPIEEEIANVSGIKTLTSNSGFGFSSIVIEFETDTEINQAVQDLKESVDRAKSELPEDATDPLVAKLDTGDVAVVTFSITGERPSEELSQIAEDLKEEFKKIKGVSTIDIIGLRKKEIQVKVSPQALESFGLSLQDVSSKIKSTNNNLPVGVINVNQLNYSVRIDNRFQSLEEIGETPLITTSDQQGGYNSTVLLRDIATITEDYPEETSISKLSINGQEATKSISIQIKKKKGANLIEVVDEAKRLTEEAQKNIAQDIQITVSNDNSQFIREDLGTLTSNGLQTTILIAITLFLALGLREGLIAAISIPLTFLMTFIILQFMGISLNSLSLFSLVIALGLMVDTAIVVMEGIFENMNLGKSPKEAALESVKTYRTALIAGTATTVFAFFPMLLVDGIIGQFLRTLPITISATLLSSLFISLTVLPGLSAIILKDKQHQKHSSILEPVFHKVGHFFSQIISGIIKKPILRILTILVTILLFAASMALPITGALKSELFPLTDVNFFNIRIETPKGLINNETETVTREVESMLYEIPEVENFVTTVNPGQSADSSNIADITVNLTGKDEREAKSYELAAKLRRDIQPLAGAKITVNETTEGPPSDAPITVRLSGEDIDELRSIATDIEGIIKEIPNTQNIRNNFANGLNEFQFTLNKQFLAYHGLSELQVSLFLRNAIQGLEATQVTFGDKELDVIVKYDQQEQGGQPQISLDQIKNLQIQSPKGYKVGIGELGDYQLAEGLSSISREEQKRTIKIQSDLSKAGNAVAVNAEIQEQLKSYKLPTGYEIAFGGEQEQVNESFQQLYISMYVGIVLIAFTLVLMFNSFRQPIIILITLPLALIGVFPGLKLIGLNLSFPAFLGVVALAGVVVNDAIVLIDRINKNRERGMKFEESIAEASEARLQPIIMTTLTTIIGIVPLALSNEFWAGLGFTLVFGLATATMLTLIVIPVLYYYFEVRGERRRLKREAMNTSG